jgi:hypothetical protein
MINFQYARATDVADAVRQIAADPTAKFIAGGTNLIDLMKEDVERPSRLIDISRLPLKSVEETADGGLRIGALLPNSDLAYHPLIAQRYPMLASAILAGASAQLRNMASTGVIFCSAPAATTSTTLRPLAISASPAAAALRLWASTACTRSSARARRASRRTPPTCAWRWRRSMPKSMWPERRARAQLRLRISIDFPGTRRSVTRICNRTRSSRRSSFRRGALPETTPT